jgi:hypothetical protein
MGVLCLWNSFIALLAHLFWWHISSKFSKGLFIYTQFSWASTISFHSDDDNTCTETRKKIVTIFIV